MLGGGGPGIVLGGEREPETERTGEGLLSATPIGDEGLGRCGGHEAEAHDAGRTTAHAEGPPPRARTAAARGELGSRLGGK